MFTRKSITAPIVFAVILALVFGASVATPAQAAGPILFAAPGGAGDCASWGTACDLQTALTGAGSGDEIWATAGTYKPTSGTDRAATFQLKAGVALYGGFAGTETARDQRNFTTNVTILSGDLNGNDNDNMAYDEPTRVDNSFHVVTGATGATLDGFTITAGNTYGAAPADGGGMYNTSGSSPTVANVILSNNTAYLDGGGMYNANSNPTLTNVTFSNNSARYGGGMSNTSSSPTLTNVTFNGNSAPRSYGGGMYNGNHSNSTLTNVTFSGNSAMLGGGLGNQTSSPTLTDVTFTNNSVTRSGGGMYNGVSWVYDNGTWKSGGSAEPVLTNVTFNGNSAEESGGGMRNSEGGNPTLTNVTFSGNSAIRYGGGMSTGDHTQATLTYVTFKDNSAAKGGGITNQWYGNLKISNAIFWGNTAQENAQIFSDDTISVSDSVVQGGCPADATCANIITTDPMLGALGNYGGLTQTIPLQAGSSAIDTSNDAACPTTDQRGVARPQGAHCGIGAYEFNAVTFTSVDAQDGWVLESSENNSAAASFRIGDNAAKKQYRGILSFKTSSLPDNAVITSVTLRVKKQAIVGGGNPVTTLQGFMVDVKNGLFGAAALQVSDFQAAASQSYGPFKPPLADAWYNINLTGAKTYVNNLPTNSGLTQIRLRFKLNNNNNAVANYLSLYSGNAPIDSRPQLVVSYYVP